MQPPKVNFLKAQSPAQKLSLLTSTVEKLFLEGKRVQILAPSDEAVKFVDELLWSYKPESFLGHGVSSRPTEEPIVITKEMANLNKADALINLLPTLPPQHFSEIYELLDMTTPQRAEAAEAKILAWNQPA